MTGNNHPHRNQRPDTPPFHWAQDAWLWAMNPRREPQPCTVKDITDCLDWAYRKGRITMAHARVLRIWGKSGSTIPPTSTSDYTLWAEAFAALAKELRRAGLIPDTMAISPAGRL